MHHDDVPAKPVPYGDVLAANVRAARARLLPDLTQASVAKRMRQLGCRWHHQTVGAVERGERPVSAYEMVALALALETAPDVLTLPPAGQILVAFGEQVVPVQRLSIVDDSVSWSGDDIKIAPPSMTYRPVDLRLAKEQDPQARAAVEEYRDQLRRDGPPPGEAESEDHPPGWRPPEPPE